MELVSRKEAVSRGLKRYFTGRPCKRGHVSERLVSTAGCYVCSRDRSNAARAANPEAARAKERERYSRNPEPRNASSKKWKVANPEKQRAYSSARHKANPERSRESWVAAGRRWSKNHPEEVRALRRRRKDRERGAEGQFTATDIARIYDAQKGRCALPHCRRHLKGKYQIDHIVPLARGGSNWPRNIQLTCETNCNQKKGAKDPITFSQEMGFLL